MKNTHGGVTVKKRQDSVCMGATHLHGCFSGSLNCANGTKSRKASPMNGHQRHALLKCWSHYITENNLINTSKFIEQV